MGVEWEFFSSTIGMGSSRLDEIFQEVPIHGLVMVYKVPTLNNSILYHALASENNIH